MAIVASNRSGRRKRVLPARLLGDGQAAVHPGLVVDAVDRENSHPAGVDRRQDRSDQVEALVFQEVRGGRGKQEQWMTPMPVRDNGHVLPQDRAVPARYLTPIAVPHRFSPPGA
jgi:hypothetical protein